MVNPIRRLRKGGMTFKEMSERSGLHVQTLYSLARLDDFELYKTIKFKTAIRMHRELGMDLRPLFKKYDGLRMNFEQEPLGKDYWEGELEL